jgi:hypothetical protein
MKEYLRELREKLEEIPADIAENQRTNKKEINKIISKHVNLEETFKDKEKKEIQDMFDNIELLLESKYHYFDSGYYCELTPEELIEEINDMIDIIENREDICLGESLNPEVRVTT